MRRTFRQLAAVQPAKYLEPNAPTGLAGLLTHPSPRSTLLYTYMHTLALLKKFPESSLYRQSAEAVTSHRMKIVEAVVPPGYKEWVERANKTIEEHPDVFTTEKGKVPHDGLEGPKSILTTVGGERFMISRPQEEYDDQAVEWDGEENRGMEPEGTRTWEERKSQLEWGAERPGSDLKEVKFEREPMLTADQINEIENRIGAGLIEEVIQVAEGELKCANVMLEAKVWEDLEEKPREGQWTYFERQKN